MVRLVTRMVRIFNRMVKIVTVMVRLVPRMVRIVIRTEGKVYRHVMTTISIKSLLLEETYGL